MMLDKMNQDYIFKKIPSVFKINTKNNIETINFNKRYSNQYVKSSNPSIILSYINTGIVNYIYLNEVFRKTNKTQEKFIYLENINSYELIVERVNEIKEVFCYVNGVYDLLAEDYYELSVNANNSYVIEFIGNVYPDKNSYFYIEYEHDNIRAEFGGEFQDQIQIDVYTTDLTTEDGTFINGMIIAKEAIREIKKFMRFGLNTYDLCVRSVTDTRDLTEISGEHFEYRYSFDVNIAYHDTYSQYYDSIEKVNFELNVQNLQEE